ncbi:FimV/HubP family polar landmark protein, partial [Alteromonas lipotrueiana]|uniref:FimV/HubP family polar landmark protein n=1 Tax=Alteromonas lipotrueiana TaxID=2803815 RepID=UPI0024847851
SPSDNDLASEVEPSNADAQSDVDNADSDVENADSDVENNEKDADSDANVDIDDIDALLDSVPEANDDEDKSEPQSDSDLAPDVEPSNADAESDVEKVENTDSGDKPVEPELPESANNETSSPSEDVSSEGKEDTPPSDLSAMPDEEVEALLDGLNEFDRDEATDPEAYTSEESVGSEFTDHESTAEEISEHDDSDQKEDTAEESERQENTDSDEELSSDDDALSLEADSERPIVEPPEPSLPSDNFEPEREDEITPSEMSETDLSSDLESAENAADELFDELDLEDENDTDFEGEPSLEFEEDSTELSNAQDDESSQSPQPVPEPEPEPEPESEREKIPDVQIDPLDSALTEFDRQLMDNIPSFTDSDQSDHSKFDDSILNDVNDAPEFALEQELDGAMPSVGPGRGDINELEDVPGLDDWLSDTKGSDKDIFDELEGADFDDLLGNMGEDSSEPAAVPGASLVSDEAEQRFKQEHPDLDLSALLNDPVQTHEKTTEADFLTVESLLDDSLQDDGKHFEEVPLDLDVSLSDYSGISDDADIIDIDKDAGQSANLDLARVYMEMDDMPTAKELLEEVAKKGSEEQQKEAGELLAGLA